MAVRAVYIPTLRKKREGWGTRGFGVGLERCRVGHPHLALWLVSGIPHYSYIFS